MTVPVITQTHVPRPAGLGYGPEVVQLVTVVAGGFIVIKSSAAGRFCSTKCHQPPDRYPRVASCRGRVLKPPMLARAGHSLTLLTGRCSSFLCTQWSWQIWQSSDSRYRDAPMCNGSCHEGPPLVVICPRTFSKACCHVERAERRKPAATPLWRSRGRSVDKASILYRLQTSSRRGDLLVMRAPPFCWQIL